MGQLFMEEVQNIEGTEWKHSLDLGYGQQYGSSAYYMNLQEFRFILQRCTKSRRQQQQGYFLKEHASAQIHSPRD